MTGITMEIKGVDRVGITHEVIACFAANQLDIIGMEVKPHYIYVKIPAVPPSQITTIMEMITQVKGIEQARMIPYLPAEERENRIHTILTTVSEGILLLDDQLRVTTINRAAQAMLNMEPEQLIHHSIDKLWGEATIEIQRCLHEAIELPSVQVNLVIGQKFPISYICSYHPIIPAEKSERQGVVIVLRDNKQIQELLSIVQRNECFTFEEIVQQSDNMRKCIETAKRVAKSDATVFLQGESGTGKELFARAIHFESSRPTGPFVPINCAAIPDALLESELFGYEQGAFTGATKGGKLGLFEIAQGGTLFLDEIGDLPLHLQAKLLRVLEERKVRRVGGSKPIPIDVRIIAATNRNLSEMTSRGQFREDLYYRLHVIPIMIPPLRERKGDIPMLAQFFMHKVCRATNQPTMQLAHSAIRALQAHHWPGNVRELQNVMERTVYLCPSNDIQAQNLYLDIQQDSSGTDPLSSLPTSHLLREQMDSYEKRLLMQALKEHTSIRQAATYLGISHTAVLQKMKKYGLSYT
ncbi:sigma 54-interacting transcriptional regulator [Brevibacillus choshinensis]|uniref:sigma 54-interacting transcriptional regulator n=1 Tax=Brevibacillus choshinensis TaxID=54911 RepID=UPI002E1AF26B|nr:sigma 54-interacting transcriptional regulator [Brevibacillus choshinensis]MED4753901.1 sigma 54-interacting transcriptional regulator [Brevibacillus choshinensis]